MKKIPHFPNLKKLELEDKKYIQAITSKFPPYSDYNFVSLWSYNVKDDIMLSQLHQNLIAKFRDYISNERFYSFLGCNKAKETIDALLNHSKRENIVPKLKLIPEDNILNNSKLFNFFQITEDRDHFDYIFSAEKLSTLQGSKFGKKRNKLNIFVKKNPSAHIDLISLTDPKIHKLIINLFLVWGKNKGKPNEDMKRELFSIKRLLKYAKFLNVLCLGVYIKNKQLIGFSIMEICHQQYSIIHFVKADPSYTGIFEFIYKSAAQELYKRKCKYINREQDLGIPGLRKAKESWRPVKYLKKYTISPKD